MKKLFYIALLLISHYSFSLQAEKKNKSDKDSISYYTSKNQSLKALDFTRRKAKQYFEEKKYSNYCDIMIERTLLFEGYNDYENALKTILESKKIAEKYNLADKLILVNWSIGNLYTTTFNYSKAKKYLHLAKRLAEKNNNQEYLIKTNQGLFRYHMRTGSDSTEYFLNKVAYYTRNSNSYEELIKNYDNFFGFYMNKGEVEKSKTKILQANELCKKIKNKNIIGNVKQNLGIYYMVGEKNYKRSIEITKEIFELFPNNENPLIISSAYLNISYAYEKLGDYKKALEYTNKYLDMQEEIYNGRLNEKTQELETKYAISQIEDKYLEKEKKLKERQEKNQKLFFVFFALLTFAGLIFYFYYQNLILRQNNKLKDLNNELQFKVISATLDGQDQERNKISSVLHDNVSAILSSVGLHLSALEGSLNEEQITSLKKTRSLLKQAHDKVRDLSHELVSPVLVKFGLQYALNDMCENLSNKLLKFEYISTIPKERKFNQEFEAKVFYIISELLNNIIKHSNAKIAQVILKEKNGKLSIVISDNGKGFDSKNIVQSNGFGLTQIRARVKNMDGTFSIKSETNLGTKIKINVEIK